MDDITIDKLGIRDEYERAIKYITWYNAVKNAETGDYSINPFGSLTYPEYPAFTFRILEAIRSEYIRYVVEITRSKS